VTAVGPTDPDLRPVDLLGQRQPHTTHALFWYRAIPGFAGQFGVVVPESYFTRTELGRCEVRCPCGATQEIKLGVIHQCEDDCGRFYVWSSKTLRVANPTAKEVRSES
jgi:hypothetical protein